MIGTWLAFWSPVLLPERVVIPNFVFIVAVVSSPVFVPVEVPEPLGEPMSEGVSVILPFNAFPIGMVKSLQEQLKIFAKKGAYLSYVEYALLQSLKRNLKNLMQRPDEHQHLSEHKKLVDEFKNKYFVKTVTVFKNVPPIYVHHLKIS